MCARGIFVYVNISKFPSFTGHHVTHSCSGGNGILNNVALAARYVACVRQRRVLVLDWDIHYCGGTAEIIRGGVPVDVEIGMCQKWTDTRTHTCK